MTKAEIVDVIARGTGLTRMETAAVVDGFLETVSFALKNGERIEIRGFGTFCLRERKEKHIQNPKTGKPTVIPHRVVPDFKPSSQLKNEVAEEMITSGKFISRTSAAQNKIFQELDGYFIRNETETGPTE